MQAKYVFPLATPMYILSYLKKISMTVDALIKKKINADLRLEYKLIILSLRREFLGLDCLERFLAEVENIFSKKMLYLYEKTK